MSVTATSAGRSGEAAGYATHEVLNQPPSLAGYNAFSGDKALAEAVAVFGADWAGDHLTRAGSIVGSDIVQELARQANRHLPELKTHDRFGNRVDLVEFHSAYHELMGLIFGTQTPDHVERGRRSRGGVRGADVAVDAPCLCARPLRA